MAYIEMLKKIAAEDERVIFTDFVEGRVLEELYSNAYVYVLPSSLEGMPLSLLEAMSYGNCCLVSDIAECTEVTEDSAFVFRKGSVKDLGEKLQMLCENSVLVDRFKCSAQDFVHQKYSWEDTVDKTLRVYRGV